MCIRDSHTVTYPTDSLITASYAADGDHVLYTYSCGVLTSVPAGATVLIQACLLYTSRCV